MIKIKLILIFLLLSTSVFPQKTTLIQNINTRANELSHSLNKTNDTLVLNCENRIFKVNIFNSNFSKSFWINSNKIEIPLNNLDVGRYAIEVILKKKHIIITLLRNEPLLKTGTEIVIKENSKTSIANKNTKTASATESIAIDDLATKKAKTKTTKKRPVTKSGYHYWVEHEINNGQSSRKIMKMASLREVEHLISKNHLDIKSLKGKSNMLTIWEVYDSSNFVKERHNSPEFMTTQSEYFNATPFYKSPDFEIK